MEKLSIGCPVCSARLSVQNVPGIENKSLTCPLCKTSSHFSAYKKYYNTTAAGKGSQDSDCTRLGGDCTQYQSEGATELPKVNYTIGCLVHTSTMARHKLKPGVNVIGRMGSSSGANIQINTGSGRSMSREHLVIDVVKVPNVGFQHHVSLYKENVNKTYIGNELLSYGEKLVLTDGMIIKLPDATLRFEIPDSEKTEV